MTEQERRDAAIEQEIVEALQSGQLTEDFLPIVSTITGVVALQARSNTHLSMRLPRYHEVVSALQRLEAAGIVTKEVREGIFEDQCLVLWKLVQGKEITQ